MRTIHASLTASLANFSEYKSETKVPVRSSQGVWVVCVASNVLKTHCQVLVQIYAHRKNKQLADWKIGILLEAIYRFLCSNKRQKITCQSNCGPIYRSICAWISNTERVTTIPKSVMKREALHLPSPERSLCLSDPSLDFHSSNYCHSRSRILNTDTGIPTGALDHNNCWCLEFLATTRITVTPHWQVLRTEVTGLDASARTSRRENWGKQATLHAIQPVMLFGALFLLLRNKLISVKTISLFFYSFVCSKCVLCFLFPQQSLESSAENFFSSELGAVQGNLFRCQPDQDSISV